VGTVNGMLAIVGADDSAHSLICTSDYDIRSFALSRALYFLHGLNSTFDGFDRQDDNLTKLDVRRA